MAEIEFLHEYGEGDDEGPYWSHEFDLFTGDPDLPSSDPNFDLDLGLGLGFPNLGPEDDDVDDYTCGFMSVAFSESEEIGADDVFDSNRVFENEDDDVDDDVRTGVQMGWDSFRLDDDRVEGEDFEWEEVVDEREVLSVFFDADVDDDLDVSVSMEMIAEEEEEELGTEDQVTSLEWELLLNIHNLDPNVEDDDDDYEMLVGTEGRKPPASRAAIEGLAAAIVKKDDVEGENCAICKDDMGIGEKVKSLPCSHRYHGFCIDIWLGMKNTCPVCRFELPTDDPEYERRRRERGGRA